MQRVVFVVLGLAVVPDVCLAGVGPKGPDPYGRGCAVPDVYPGPQSPLSIVAADFDGKDGPDVATADGWGGAVTVLLNRGDGTFDTAVPYPVGGTLYDIVSSDFDGQDGPDLAVVTYQGDRVFVLLNDGTGGFAPAVEYPIVDGGSYSIVTADFDGRAGPDLAVGDGRGVAVLLNDGTGRFAPAVLYEGASPFVDTLAVADFDRRDGPDLIWSHLGGGFERAQVSARLNLGDGTFGPETLLTSSFTVAPGSGIAITDVDGSDGPDVIHIDYYYAGLQVLLNDGAGGLVRAQHFSLTGNFGGPWDVTAADLDCLSGEDLIVANDDNLAVFLSNGAGFDPPFLYDGGWGPRQSAVADFDGSQGPDWATADANQYAVTVSLNCLGFACLRLTWLLRSTAITSLAPITPPLAEIFDQDPQRGLLIDDGYIEDFASGSVDPDPTIAVDESRPLVFYQVSVDGNSLRLTRQVDTVRIDY